MQFSHERIELTLFSPALFHYQKVRIDCATMNRVKITLHWLPFNYCKRIEKAKAHCMASIGSCSSFSPISPTPFCLPLGFVQVVIIIIICLHVSITGFSLFKIVF